MSDNDTVLVLAASYGDVADAAADYEAVKALYYEVETSHEFDAAVVARDQDGEIKVVKKHEQPTRHGAAHGLGWGLAVGAACAIFPAVGLVGGLAVGGGAGAAIGAVTGHMKGGMDDEDLKALGDVLGEGEAGLIVVYSANMADQVAANVKAVNKQRLIDDGRAAKVACMRRTLFIESTELVPIVLSATRELAARGRERFLAGNGLTPACYERTAEQVTERLAGRALSARQLRQTLGTAEPISPVIIVMCDQARLVRWKGSRGWRSAQPTYRRFDEALPDARLDAWEEGAAVRELIDRYVRRYGPVSENDIAWWTALPKATVRDALASLPNLVHATIEGSRVAFLIHESDVAAAQRRLDSRAEEISLLPVLDLYLQGYRDRERCVDPSHRPFIVDRGGNSTSVILIGGRVAGVWDSVATPSPELRLFFFGSPHTATRARVLAAASETAEFLTGEPVPVMEVDVMTPLTQRTAGSFLSPLKDAR